MRVQRNDHTGEYRVDFGNGQWIPARVQRNDNTGEMRVIANGQIYPYSPQQPAGQQETALPQENNWDMDAEWGMSPQGLASNIRSIKNIPSSAKRFAGDLVDLGKNIVTDPVGFGRSVGNVLEGYETKGANKFIPEHLREEYFKFFGIDPQKEAYADAVNQHFAERYGSLENLSRGDFSKMGQTFETDPIGMMGDLSAIFSAGGGLARGLGKVANTAGASGVASGFNTVADLGKTASRYTDPLLLAGKIPGATADITGISGKLGRARESFSQRLYLDALQPSGRNIDTAASSRLARTALDEGLLPTPQGVTDLITRRGELKANLNRLIRVRTALEETGVLPKTIHPESVVQGAMNWAEGVHQHAADPRSAMRAIDRAGNNFLDGHGTEPINTARAQAMKERIQGDINTLYKNRSSAAKDVQKGFGYELRQGIEANVPETVELNQRIQGLIDLEKNLRTATARISKGNNGGFSFPAMAGGAGGSAIGSMFGGAPAAALGSMLGSRALSGLGSPLTRAKMGMRVNRLGRGDGSPGRFELPARFGRLYQSTDPEMPQPLSLIEMLGNLGQ